MLFFLFQLLVFVQSIFASVRYAWHLFWVFLMIILKISGISKNLRLLRVHITLPFLRKASQKSWLSFVPKEQLSCKDVHQCDGKYVRLLSCSSQPINLIGKIFVQVFPSKAEKLLTCLVILLINLI